MLAGIFSGVATCLGPVALGLFIFLMVAAFFR